MDLVEAEIKEAKIKFEEDILRIGEKADNPNLVKKLFIIAQYNLISLILKVLNSFRYKKLY